MINSPNTFNSHPAPGQYRDYAGVLTLNARSSLPDVPALKSRSHNIGTVLRALAVWEAHADGSPDRSNELIQRTMASPKIIEEIEDLMNDRFRRWPYFQFKGKGAGSVVLVTREQEALRLTTEPENTRIKSRIVLQPEEAGDLGSTGLRYERLKLARTDNITYHHVNSASIALAREGNFLWDKGTDNVGLVDNKVRVLDGGATWTQTQLLNANPIKYADWVYDYKAMRRQCGLPELAS